VPLSPVLLSRLPERRLQAAQEDLCVGCPGVCTECRSEDRECAEGAKGGAQGWAAEVAVRYVMRSGTCSIRAFSVMEGSSSGVFLDVGLKMKYVLHIQGRQSQSCMALQRNGHKVRCSVLEADGEIELHLRRKRIHKYFGSRRVS